MFNIVQAMVKDGILNSSPTLGPLQGDSILLASCLPQRFQWRRFYGNKKLVDVPETGEVVTSVIRALVFVVVVTNCLLGFVLTGKMDIFLCMSYSNFYCGQKFLFFTWEMFCLHVNGWEDGPMYSSCWFQTQRNILKGRVLFSCPLRWHTFLLATDV